MTPITHEGLLEMMGVPRVVDILRVMLMPVHMIYVFVDDAEVPYTAISGKEWQDKILELLGLKYGQKRVVQIVVESRRDGAVRAADLRWLDENTVGPIGWLPLWGKEKVRKAK